MATITSRVNLVSVHRGVKPKVVLYNPPAPHYTMPLSLIAVGSALDRREVDVRIIDARVDRDPLNTLASEARDALCVGMTVLTGEPILGAVEATRLLRKSAPGTPVVWGGWHPSLFARQCIEEGGADVAVSGQGELTFLEIVQRRAEGRDLHGCRGCTHAESERIVGERPRELADLETLARHDFSLIDAEPYFRAKGRRQMDYISSQGCPFRCAFCADPEVYRRKWTGLGADRMVEEIADLHRRLGFDDLAFQDETFFTSTGRIGAMCEGFLTEGLGLTWTATMRADQGVRLDEEVWSLARRSGLRRVLVGVESGDPEMLVKIQKDITLEQVFATADRCRQHGIAGIFPFIVGLPGETEAGVEATLTCARRLCEMSPDFEAHLFFYKPYPGNPLADQLSRAGYALPSTLEEWARFDFVGTSSPWVSPGVRRRVEAFRFYLRTGFSRGSWWRAPQRAIARLRCRYRRFEWPVEKVLAERLAATPGRADPQP